MLSICESLRIEQLEISILVVVVVVVFTQQIVENWIYNFALQCSHS